MRIERPPACGLRDFSLRQLEHSDVAAWYAYISLPNVIEHTSWDVTGPQDLTALCRDYESSAPDSPCRFAVIADEVQQLAGTIGLVSISHRHRSAEIAYDFSPQYWGQGVATAMCSAVTRWAHSALSMTRVQATVLETNAASERVLQKCGYTYEGLLRSHRMIRGRPGNFKMYSRLAGDAWQ